MVPVNVSWGSGHRLFGDNSHLRPQGALVPRAAPAQGAARRENHPRRRDAGSLFRTPVPGANSSGQEDPANRRAPGWGGSWGVGTRLRVPEPLQSRALRPASRRPEP